MVIFILPRLNTHSDELKKLVLEPKLSLERGYQLTYYTKVNNENSCVGVEYVRAVVVTVVHGEGM